MLDPKDVRVGNWVIKVTGKDANSKAFFEYKPIAIDEYYFTWANYCFPIKLTLVILGICGFKQELCDWYKNLPLVNGEEVQVLRCKYKQGWYIKEFKVPMQPLYLHQVQNLYYVLTGQELSIDLEPFKNLDVLHPVHSFYNASKAAELEGADN